MKRIMHITLTLVVTVLLQAACSLASTSSSVTPMVELPTLETKATQKAKAKPPSAATPTSQAAPEAEVYAVYSAVIQTRYIDTRKPELIVIGDETGLDYFSGTLGDHLKSVRQGLPDLTDEVSANFETQNQQPQPLKPLLTLSVKYVFISQSEIEMTFKGQDGWKIFYDKYPNAQGHMRLSGVGFNPQRDLALVYVDNMSQALMGGGYYILLKKVNDKWTIQNQVSVWIS
jgi:hypothetical protein